MPNLSLHAGLAAMAGAIIACLIACASVAGLVIFASWASSVALILTSPNSGASAPHRVGLCHVVAALIGVGIHAFLPQSPWAIGLSVGMAVAIVSIGDIMHPPAIANAAFAFVSTAQPAQFAATAVLGGVLLACFAFVQDRFVRTGNLVQEVQA